MPEPGSDNINLWHLLAAVPALVAAPGLVALASFANVEAERPDNARHYERAAEAALEAGQAEAAEIYARKRVVLSPGSREARLELAKAALAAGRNAFAREQIAALAPDDARGFAPAHRYLVDQLRNAVQATQDVGRRDQLLDRLEQQLGRLLDIDGNDKDARTLLGDLLVARGKARDAIPHLEHLAEVYPAHRMRLAKLHLALGEKPAAKFHAERAIVDLEKIVETDARNATAWIALSQAYVFQGRYADASRILETRADVDGPGREQVRTALSFLYASWFQQATTAAPTDRGGQPLETPADPFQLLDRAIRLNPDNPVLLQRLTQIATRGGEAGRRIRTMLEDALVGGQAPMPVHFLLGTQAALEDDFTRAALHLEQAHRLAPEAAGVLNNLAFVLARSEKPELDRALKMVDRAIALRPEDPAYRDTRGHILVELGEFQDAIGDLEMALGGLPSRKAELHTALATAYEALGQESVAEKHRDAAKAG